MSYIVWNFANSELDFDNKLKMNTVEKAALLRNRDAIVQNVDFTYIREKLVAYGVLTVEEVEDVNCEVSFLNTTFHMFGLLLGLSKP